MSSFIRRCFTLCLLASWSLFLSSCQSSFEQRLTSHFLSQKTVSCSIQSNLVFSSLSSDSAEKQLSCSISATAQTQLDSDFFHMEGTMSKSLDGLDLGSTELESFYDPLHNESYSRFGSQYSVTGSSTGLGSLVKLPKDLRLDENYMLQEESELILGSVCDVYVGSELSAEINIPVYAFGTHTSFSLADIPIQVRLAADPETALPIKMTLSFLPEGLHSSFSLPDGTEYTLSELTYEVTYQHYGQPIETSVPDGFRQLALSSKNPDSSEKTDITSNAPPEPSDSYTIETPNRSSRYQIFTPEYMAPESVSDSQASFYYFYSEEDFELIEYNLWEDFSPQDAAAYTNSLPQLLRESGNYGNLSSSKVNNIAIDGKQVQYRVIHFQTAENDLVYDGILVYSWCSAPNESDVLEVVLWEYNGSENSKMIDPEEELCYAYHYAIPAAEN